MSVAYEPTQTEMFEGRERSILDSLKNGRRAPAEEVVRAIQSQNHYITTEPIVTAVWSLSAQGRIRVGGDWTITLREAKSSATQTEFGAMGGSDRLLIVQAPSADYTRSKPQRDRDRILFVSALLRL